MKILADENVDRLLVDWLRASGHDIVWVAESAPSAPDQLILAQAISESRIIVTFDRDFGELVFRGNAAVLGVLYLRLRANNPAELLAIFQRVWNATEKRLNGSFIVASNRSIRIRSLSI